MSTEGGPKIVRGDLELHLDTSTPKSFPGESTTNNAGTGNRYTSWNNSGTATWVNNDSSVDRFFPDIQVNSMEKLTAGNSHIGVGYGAIDASTWTASVYVYIPGNAGTLAGSAPYFRSYPANTSRGTLAYNGDTNWNNWPKNQWIRIERSWNNTAGDTTMYISCYVNNVGNKIYLTAPQLEKKSYSTPFVNGTRGTSVATGGGWRDRSGNSRHGELKNGLVGTYTNRKSRVLDFDGSSDYIDFGSDITISPANQGWTAIYVFKTDSASTLQHFNSAEADDFNANWLAILSSKLAVWDHGQGVWKYGNTQFSDGTWYHVAFVQESGTSMQYYVNGVAEGGDHTSFTFSSGYSALKTRYIGRYEYNGGYSRYFNGKIPIVQMYSRALTASEIQANFNSVRGRFDL